MGVLRMAVMSAVNRVTTVALPVRQVSATNIPKRLATKKPRIAARIALRPANNSFGKISKANAKSKRI